ncbi:glycerate kinase [Enterococcus sp. 669A]|uniref:Glycerate kinase n=1 Tax=Candidatus Enterococcus moelleringii TaxID=2815325 RepID=A0ABS3L8H4_9ENTE|nr:glycerate kinase [Enterococcus sp. 669A]MBO1305920.1 glycerate kinase [Enterococcus sp. 669A]
MNILIAMDSFKGSVTSLEAGAAVKQGIVNAGLTAETVILPVADGGEGTIEAFVDQTNGRTQTLTVTGPLGEKVEAAFGVIGDQAIIEVAETSGITLVKKADLNPWRATSFGLGELIKKLISDGQRKFIVGLGGSATNDGGLGMLQALGYRFIGKDGSEIGRNICEIEHMSSVDDSQVLPALKKCHFLIASDVTNPLVGENGATAIFGPQKGVKEAEIKQIDQLLQHFAEVTTDYVQKDVSEIPGAGAAGGLGFAFIAYLQAEIQPGFPLLAKEKNLAEKIKAADLVITGEGRLDAQSVMGKVPSALAKLAQKEAKPIIAIAGSVSDDVGQCNAHGIDAFFPIIRQIAPEEETLKKETTVESIRQTAEQLFRFYQKMK